MRGLKDVVNMEQDSLKQDAPISVSSDNVIHISGEPFTKGVSPICDVLEHHVAQVRDKEKEGVVYPIGIYISVGFDSEGLQHSTVNYVSDSKRIPLCIMPELAKALLQERMTLAIVDERFTIDE